MTWKPTSRVRLAGVAAAAVAAFAASAVPAAAAIPTPPANTDKPAAIGISGAPTTAFTNQKSFTLSLTTEATSLLKCRTGLVARQTNAAWSNCASGLGSKTINRNNLPDGDYYWDFWAVNYDYYQYLVGISQSTAPAISPLTMIDFTIDTVVPAEPNASGSHSGGALSNSPDETVTFSGEQYATFTCSIDGGSYEPCASPLSLNSLSDGNHTVDVKQTDRAGNTSSAARIAWTTDVTPPAAPKVGADYSNEELTSSNANPIIFTGEAGATFECSVDAGPYQPCTSPLSLEHLEDGNHNVSVRQIDAAGNTSDATTIGWKVDTTPPNAPTLGGSPAAGITLSTNDPDATFLCSIDGGAYAACTSPVDVTGLADGHHTISVKAVDPAGNESGVTDQGFDFDRTAPDAPTLDGAPSGTVNSGETNISFTTNDGSATFLCSLDGGAYTTCTSPWTNSGASELQDGPHSLSVKAVDPAGNESAVTTKSWRVRRPFYPVDFTAPTTVTKSSAGNTPWVISLHVTPHNGDTRGGAQALTVQISESTTQPSDSQAIPTTPSYAQGILTYGETMSRRALRRQPRWIRVGTKVGKWTGWQPITRL